MYLISGNNNFQDRILNELVSASSTYALTKEYLRTCSTKNGTCSCSGSVACRSCPVKAFYDRKFDMLADIEEEKEEARKKASERHCVTSLGSILSRVAI